MAVEAINLGHIDKIWIVPCGDREDKKNLLKGDKRYKMLEIIINDFFKENKSLVEVKSYIIIK